MFGQTHGYPPQRIPWRMNPRRKWIATSLFRTYFNVAQPCGTNREWKLCYRHSQIRFIWFIQVQWELMMLTAGTDRLQGFIVLNLDIMWWLRQRSFRHSFNWNKYVWSINTSQKLKLFLWKTGRGDLPLGENFQARGLSSFETCPHCEETESETHLFLECPYAQQVWTRAPISTLPDFTSTSTPLQALMMASSLVGLPPMGIISDIFSWICWNILTARNNLLFENRPISASTTMMNAISGAREWLVAQESSKPLCHILPLCRPPTHLPQEFTPCNSDRAWTGDSLTAGLGWIIHCDRVGQQIQGSSSCDFISSPLLVEAIALKMTLLAAHSYFISKVWIRSDSKGLIRAINSKTYSMELFGVLTNIEFLSASFDFVFFSSRENRTQQLTY